MIGPNSFCLSNSLIEASAIQCLSPYTNVVNHISFDNYHFSWNGELKKEDFLFEVENGKLIVIGCPRLISKSIDLCGDRIRDIWSGNKFELMANIAGPYCFIFLNEQEEVTIYNNPMGESPVYYFESDSETIITSELKIIISLSKHSIELIPFVEFGNIHNRKNDFCIIKNWKKLPAAHFIKKAKNETIAIERYNLTEDKAINFEYSNPLDIVTAQLHDEQFYNSKQCLPLSGGIDSATLGSLMQRAAIDFESYTIGTAYGNEFDGAKKSSEYIKSSHHNEMTISAEMFWPAFVHGIYLNEFTHPIFAEGYVGYYLIMENSSALCCNVVSGYGADVLLGDLRDHKNVALKHFMNSYIEQGNITGEFHPFMAHYFDKKMIHLFWNSSMLAYSNKLLDKDKMQNGISKFKFREILSNNDILPNHIIYADKKAFHTGSGMPSLFNNILGIKDDEYQYKSKVLFIILKLLFEEQILHSEITLDLVKKKINQYDFD